MKLIGATPCCRLYDDLSAGDQIRTSSGAAYLMQATRPNPSKP